MEEDSPLFKFDFLGYKWTNKLMLERIKSFRQMLKNPMLTKIYFNPDIPFLERSLKKHFTTNRPTYWNLNYSTSMEKE